MGFTARSGSTSGSGGDMFKTTYDKNGNSIVDLVEAISGVDVAGTSTYYGKNGAGAIGFHTLPSSGTGDFLPLTLVAATTVDAGPNILTFKRTTANDAFTETYAASTLNIVGETSEAKRVVVAGIVKPAQQTIVEQSRNGLYVKADVSSTHGALLKVSPHANGSIEYGVGPNGEGAKMTLDTNAAGDAYTWGIYMPDLTNISLRNNWVGSLGAAYKQFKIELNDTTEFIASTNAADGFRFNGQDITLGPNVKFKIAASTRVIDFGGTISDNAALSYDSAANNFVWKKYSRADSDDTPVEVQRISVNSDLNISSKKYNRKTVALQFHNTAEVTANIRVGWNDTLESNANFIIPKEGINRKGLIFARNESSFNANLRVYSFTRDRGVINTVGQIYVLQPGKTVVLEWAALSATDPGSTDAFESLVWRIMGVHDQLLGAAVTGDMSKSLYDTNNNGIVDQAEAISGISGAANSTYYGKDGTGVIGFHAISAGGGSVVADSTINGNILIDGVETVVFDAAGVAYLGNAQNWTAVQSWSYAAEGQMIKGKLSADTNERIEISNAGTLKFGSGAALPDTTLSRSAANKLLASGTLDATTLMEGGVALTDKYAAKGSGSTVVDSTINGNILINNVETVVYEDTDVAKKNQTNLFSEAQYIERPVGGTALNVRVAGQTASIFTIGMDGYINWGPGGTVATDTQLHRNGVNSLRTPGNFLAAGTLDAVGGVKENGILLSNIYEKKVSIGTTAPTDTAKLWIDTSVSPNLWKRYNGTGWETIGGGGGSTAGDASDLAKGITKLSVAPAVATDPIAIGNNDPRIGIFTKTQNGIVPAPSGATSTRFLREDGTWVIPTNTTYSVISDLEMDSATNTTGRLLTGQRVNSWATRKGFLTALPAHTHNAVEIDAGTLADARLSANVPLKNAVSNVFTGTVDASVLKEGGVTIEDKYIRLTAVSATFDAVTTSILNWGTEDLQRLEPGSAATITSVQGMVANEFRLYELPDGLPQRIIQTSVNLQVIGTDSGEGTRLLRMYSPDGTKVVAYWLGSKNLGAEYHGATSTTNTAIKFNQPYVYGTTTTPIAGAVTIDTLNAVVGMTSVIIGSSTLAFPATVKLSGTLSTTAGQVNVVHIQYINSTLQLATVHSSFVP